MSASAVIEHVKASLVALKMPRALEILDVTLRGISYVFNMSNLAGPGQIKSSSSAEKP